MMREKYVVPDITIEAFEASDILTVSESPNIMPIADISGGSQDWNAAWDDQTLR